MLNIQSIDVAAGASLFAHPVGLAANSFTLYLTAHYEHQQLHNGYSRRDVFLKFRISFIYRA